MRSVVILEFELDPDKAPTLPQVAKAAADAAFVVAEGAMVQKLRLAVLNSAQAVLEHFDALPAPSLHDKIGN